MIKLFACDLDGTLLNWLHATDKVILDAVREITDAGAHIAIATGRTMRTAYDSGFALSTDDRKPFDRQEDGETAVVENEDGYCRVSALAGEGKGKILIPDPNTNLVSPKTTIPMAVYRIVPGTQTIRTKVDYM